MMHYIKIDKSRKPTVLNDMPDDERAEINDFIKKYTGNAIPENSMMVPIKPAKIANFNVKFLPINVAQKLATAGQLYLDASIDFEVYLVATSEPYRRSEHAEGFNKDLQSVTVSEQPSKPATPPKQSWIGKFIRGALTRLGPNRETIIKGCAKWSQSYYDDRDDCYGVFFSDNIVLAVVDGNLRRTSLWAISDSYNRIGFLCDRERTSQIKMPQQVIRYAIHYHNLNGDSCPVGSAAKFWGRALEESGVCLKDSFYNNATTKELRLHGEELWKAYISDLKENEGCAFLPYKVQ